MILRLAGYGKTDNDLNLTERYAVINFDLSSIKKES